MFLSNLPSQAAQEHRDWFASADTDSDDRVSLEEFQIDYVNLINDDPAEAFNDLQFVDVVRLSFHSSKYRTF